MRGLTAVCSENVGSKRSARERTFFWAFPEHPDSNLHYHLMVKLSDPTKRIEFESIAVHAGSASLVAEI